MIFITHAHLDHIGILPDIIKYGFKGKVYCTQATHKLIITMLICGGDKENNENLLDKISFMDIDGRHNEKPNNGFGKTYISIANNFYFGILRTSHVLGSCAFYFKWSEKNDNEWKWLHFSGDIGAITDTVMANIVFKGHQTPYWNECEKCIVLESTYGKQIRNKDDIFQRKIKKLSEIIDDTISKNGIVIIPAFALYRAQQILIDLFYIIKSKENKEMETILSDKINNNWKYIIVNTLDKVVCNDIVNKIKSLQGKDNRKLRKKIKKEIEQIYMKNGYAHESCFSKTNEKCQNEIATVFEKNNIQKHPFEESLRIENKINFSFDSPLIGRINEIYLNHLTDESYSNKDDKRKFKYLSDNILQKLSIGSCEFVEQKKEIKSLLSCFMKETKKTGTIIVTASGMCDEGRCIPLLEKYLPDENATIIHTGFQAYGTNGFLLKNLSSKKYEEDNNKEKIPLELNKSDLRLADVKCNIEDMAEYYSGHADQQQLLDYIKPDKRNTGKITVLINHGTDDARETLKSKIEEMNNNINVLLPEFNKWLNVATFEYEPEDIEFDKEVTRQFCFLQIGDIHIYYPIEYDNEKIQKIINYIEESS
jgi:Cft2 family RNA processing exonuclease